MIKTPQKAEALKLRHKGFGINEISRKIGVRKNSVSLWCRGIALTKSQKAKLKARTRILGRKNHHAAMKKRIEENQIKITAIERQAIREIGKLNQRELFLLGIALYWAEGFKHRQEKALGFANSDPKLIKFYLNWLRKSLGVEKKEISLRLTVNILLSKRVNEFRRFWSLFLGIPTRQFTKPFFQKVKQKKVYPKNKIYYGVLRVRVLKSSFLFKKMRGWIKGLSGVSRGGNLLESNKASVAQG